MFASYLFLQDKGGPLAVLPVTGASVESKSVEMKSVEKENLLQRENLQD